MSRGRVRDGALSRFVQVRARYRRAMNLERDTGHAGTLAGYLVTPVVRRALARIASGLVANGTERAWSLTGPYGSGKTAFAVFLSDLFGQAAAPRRAAHHLLGLADAPLSRSLQRALFVPVILTGERAPLDLLLVRALRAALEAEPEPTPAAQVPSGLPVTDEVQNEVETPPANDTDPTP